MANDMNSAINALRGILGDNADEKIRQVMGSLTQNNDMSNSVSQPVVETSVEEDLPVEQMQQVEQNDTNTQAEGTFDSDSMQYLMKIKNVVDEMGHTANDPRSNLLMSLRPYMREGRRRSIDNAVRMLNITKLSGFFK